MGLPPPPFIFSFYFIFLSVSSVPSCRSWWQLQFSSSSVTVYQPRGAEDNYYFQELKDMREIWVPVMATFDRYCHPEGISKRHLIFTYQHQPYSTGKHVSPPQNPLFNCFELSILCCLSPPVSEGAPASHMHSESQMLCTAAKYNARVTSLLVRRGRGTLWLPFCQLQWSPLLLAVDKTPRQRHLPGARTSVCLEEHSTATPLYIMGHPRTPWHLPSTTVWEHGPGGHALLFCTSGRRGGLAPLKAFSFFTNVLLWKWIFSPLGQSSDHSRAGRTGRKDKQSHHTSHVTNNALLWLVSTGP